MLTNKKCKLRKYAFLELFGTFQCSSYYIIKDLELLLFSLHNNVLFLFVKKEHREEYGKNSFAFYYYISLSDAKEPKIAKVSLLNL